MNVWQVAQQIKYLLEQQKWSGGTKPVFGSVHVTNAIRQEGYKLLRFPLALVRPGAAVSDPEHREEPDLVQQDFTVTVAVSVAADAIGEAALLGANRVGGAAESGGKGLLEVEEMVATALEKLVSVNGIVIALKGKGAPGSAIEDGTGRYLAWRDYNFDALTTEDVRFYHPPTRLKATASGGGAVALTWKLPPDRFDRLKVVLRRASGGTPPSSVTAGTGVTLSADLATSVTDTPGVGTFSYALFAQYDETNATPTTADKTSAADTVTVTAT